MSTHSKSSDGPEPLLYVSRRDGIIAACGILLFIMISISIPALLVSNYRPIQSSGASPVTVWGDTSLHERMTGQRTHETSSPKAELRHGSGVVVDNPRRHSAALGGEPKDDFFSPSPWANFSYVCNAEDLQSLELLLAPQDVRGYPTPMNGSNCCVDWPGISCSAAGRVTGIGLRVDGTLPSSFYLPFLQSLTLSFNKGLWGTLPPEWSRMSNLQSLGMSFTAVSGTLPPEWGNMTSLTFMDLSITSIGGTLPPEWGALTNLNMLFLSQTLITGTLPPEWCNMKALSMLVMSSLFYISGSLPAAWNGMTNLNTLDLCSSTVGGTLPPEWGNMTSLQGLSLCSTSISGTIPPEWSNMKSLLSLYLFQTQLSGTLPPQLGALSNMRIMQLHQTSISGTLPPEWGNMTNMNIMYIFQTYISGTIPTEWAQMRLSKFDAAETLLEGAIPHALALRDSLTILNLGSTSISGSIPDTFTQLQRLDVSRTKVTGALPCFPACMNLALLADHNPGIDS
jgi:hypothetical protein